MSLLIRVILSPSLRRCLPLNFLSHSLSVAELGFIFSSRCLGDLQGRTVCDVGSRLGPVL